MTTKAFYGKLLVPKDDCIMLIE